MNRNRERMPKWQKKKKVCFGLKSLLRIARWRTPIADDGCFEFFLGRRLFLE